MLEMKNPSANLTVTELLSKSHQMTKNGIFGWLQNLNPNTDDVVFVYFSGHGGTDTETKDMYITLQAKQRLYRKEIVEALEGLDCRLKMLITDARVFLDPHPVIILADPFADTKPALYNLFFEHEGFLNISSASEGEIAVGDSREGGCFTRSLLDTIWEGVEIGYIDFEPQDGFVSWSEVFELTKEATMERFDRNKNAFPPRVLERMQKAGQTTQTPKYFGELPKRFER